jgi:(1->4)-alpha-D-glucan 1-alpha-D-glucosylmutase
MLLMLTSPGVPDLYQGTELWSLQLVDPDNRMPVDYDERRRAMMALKFDDLGPRTIWSRAGEGLPKLWVVREALRLRARRPAAFDNDGTYVPLIATGRLGAHVVAFRRGSDVITVVPRWVLGACGRWRDAEIALPQGVWRNVLTGAVPEGNVSLEEIWRDFPVALFEREGP